MLTVHYVRNKIFGTKVTDVQGLVFCNWIVELKDSGLKKWVEIAPLLCRMKKDYEDFNHHWTFIYGSVSFEDFVSNLPDYCKMREKFPTRDQEPLDKACFPLSNEKMYGKGINSNVRM